MKKATEMTDAEVTEFVSHAEILSRSESEWTVEAMTGELARDLIRRSAQGAVIKGGVQAIAEPYRREMSRRVAGLPLNATRHEDKGDGKGMVAVTVPEISDMVKAAIAKKAQ